MGRRSLIALLTTALAEANFLFYLLDASCTRPVRTHIAVPRST